MMVISVVDQGGSLILGNDQWFENLVRNYPGQPRSIPVNFKRPIRDDKSGRKKPDQPVKIETPDKKTGSARRAEPVGVLPG